MGEKNTLKFNTYKPGGAKFDQFYQNSKNNIEDPIFTGFTFDIDELNSPLFFTLCGDEYNESLRSLSGTKTDLSTKIEEKLSSVYKFHINGTPDSYEINTTYTKDMLGNDHRAGYGLQERYYMDKPLYGAVDYIYMVDKVSKGNYDDDEGVRDLGNGTSSNFYLDNYNAVFDIRKEMQIALINDKIAADPNYDPDKDEQEEMNLTIEEALDMAINKLNEKLENNKSDHDANVAAFERENTSTGPQIDELEKKEKELNELTQNIENTHVEITNKLQGFKNVADAQLKVFNSVVGNKSEAKTKINDSYNEFLSYFNIDISKDKGSRVEKTINNNYIVTLSIPSDRIINSEIGNNSIASEKKEYEESYRKIYLIQNTRISDFGESDNLNNDIHNKKDEILKLGEKIYGTQNGEVCTKDNPAKDSLYAKYLAAKDKMENDVYSKTKEQLEEYQYRKEKYTDSKDYYDETRGSYSNSYARYDDQGYADVTVTNNEFAKKEYEENRYKRETFEVPQTVYDMMGFINTMKSITKYHPYTFQTVTGLDEAYKKYFEVKDPYMGSGDDTISIECLDYLDLKVSSMFNKYFNAVYDRQYRRERVPINLRRFNCSIFVHDIRNFKNSLNGGEYPGDVDLRPIVEMALNYVSAIEFKFYDCEFIPEETGGIFDNVSNVDFGDMTKTKFTFRYGNCVINFLPFEDLRKYLLEDIKLENIQPKVFKDEVGSNNNEVESTSGDGNFRRWFDKSVLGNVNNNDYRDYIRHDSSVAVDDHFKTTIVNNFALNSVVNKNEELTAMDDALRRIVVGISASTGVPVKGVTDALNIGFIDPILNERDLATPVVQKIGNVNNSKVIDVNTMEYIGEANNKSSEKEFIDFLGNVNDNNKKGGK